MNKCKYIRPKCEERVAWTSLTRCCQHFYFYSQFLQLIMTHPPTTHMYTHTSLHRPLQHPRIPPWHIITLTHCVSSPHRGYRPKIAHEWLTDWTGLQGCKIAISDIIFHGTTSIASLLNQKSCTSARILSSMLCATPISNKLNRARKNVSEKIKPLFKTYKDWEEKLIFESFGQQNMSGQPTILVT